MKFLYNYPALFHKGALIIGDTHFGMEEKLKKKGIYAEEISSGILKKIKFLIRKTKAKKLIFLGDVKENVAYVDYYTKKIFQELKGIKNLEIIIVRGNHDGGIEDLELQIFPSDGFVYEKIGLVHGHSWPSDKVLMEKNLISAHQHPQIEFIDKLGKRHVEPVWVSADIDVREAKKHFKKFNKKLKLILIPAFNPLVGNSLKSNSNEHLGPLFVNKIFKWEHAIIFRLDGTTLGKVKDLVKNFPERKNFRKSRSKGVQYGK